MSQLTSSALRQALGQFATGVTVVTALTESGQAIGLTVNSFASLSLDPPLVTWALQATSQLREQFDVGRQFAVNVLANNQADLSQWFAASRPHPFVGVAHTITTAGFVLLDEALASFECETQSAQLAGDHILLIAKVVRLTHNNLASLPPGSSRLPLLFYQGDYHELNAPLPQDDRPSLRS